MTNKEIGATIKSELKAAGYSVRDFSVRVKDCGYSESIHIKIKSPTVNRKEVADLLAHWEVIDRDERTGEILQGGNCYLFIDYADGIFSEVANEYRPTAENLLKEAGGDSCIKIFDGLYFIVSDQFNGPRLHQQDNKGHADFYIWGAAQLAELIYKFVKFGTIAA